MDLLYQRYASPFDYLQQLIVIDNLLQGVTYIISQENERKMWELYLHSFPSDSFDNWKKKVVGSDRPVKEMSRNEIVNVVNKSQNILNTFSIK